MFHKEGFRIITIAAMLLVIGIVILDDFTETYLLQKVTQVSVLLPFLGILYYYRNSRRTTEQSETTIIAPIDGKVIMIKEIHESEYFHDTRLQITFSMALLDVHVTRYPCSGAIKHSSNFRGKQHGIQNQKDSKDCERNSVIISTKQFEDVLYHQNSAMFGKRIVNYATEGNQAVQGQDSGFMDFSATLDLILPLHTKIKVHIGDKVRGGEQIIGCI